LREQRQEAKVIPITSGVALNLRDEVRPSEARRDVRCAPVDRVFFRRAIG